MRLLPAPIFKPHLLSAIYAKKKTQTRRIANEQPSVDVTALSPEDQEHRVFPNQWSLGGNCGAGWMELPLKEPYGKQGDFWYFREGLTRNGTACEYRLDRDLVNDRGNPDFFPMWKWKRNTLPSIHMPREHARRFAWVTSVRVERVQDISEEDATAEGIIYRIYDPGLCDGGKPGWEWRENHFAGSAKHGFELLWDHINAKRGHSWSKNDWVWAYEFELVPRSDVQALLDALEGK